MTGNTYERYQPYVNGRGYNAPAQYQQQPAPQPGLFIPHQTPQPAQVLLNMLSFAFNFLPYQAKKKHLLISYLLSCGFS